MRVIPLLLQLRDFVAGHGFLAHVLLDGRALLITEDDGDHWVYGVQPGAVAGGAAEWSAALKEFQDRYRSVLFDIASEAATFKDFARQVSALFSYSDETDAASWDMALGAGRQANAPRGALPMRRAETVPSRLEVQEVVGGSQFLMEPEMNQLVQVLEAV